jgi:hypothetical protein
VLDFLFMCDEQVRWFTKFDLTEKDIVMDWPSLLATIRDNCKPPQGRQTVLQCSFAPKLLKKLYGALDTDSKEASVKIQAALCVDILGPLRKSCLFLEGDYALAPYLIDQWEIIRRHLTNCASAPEDNMPNSAAIVRECKLDDDDEEEFWESTKESVDKVLSYVQDRTQNDPELRDALPFFEAAVLWRPERIAEMNLTDAQMTIELRKIPFVSDQDVQDLVAERKAYEQEAAVALAMSPDELEQWWSRRENTLPHWSRMYFRVALVQPSEATVERVFSLLVRRLADEQEAQALEDLVNSTVSRRYNQLQREHSEK